MNMAMAASRVSVILLLCGMIACGEEMATEPLVGADRDAHGCIGSAGYAWCATTARCERPWELAQAKGLELTADGFDRYCSEAD
jgi:hypothetical protein